MKCEDCICYEACVAQVKAKYQDATDTVVENLANGKTNCEHFKDKNKIIELPCKVGDIYYTIDLQRNKIQARLIDNMLQLVAFTEFGVFGNTVFLSKAEVENKLKGGEI